jgi:hypothetical protein
LADGECRRAKRSDSFEHKFFTSKLVGSVYFSIEVERNKLVALIDDSRLFEQSDS